MKVRNSNVRSLQEIRINNSNRVKAYRANLELEKKIALRKKDANRKMLKRKNTVLTEHDKKKIRDGNNLRKRRQRERE